MDRATAPTSTQRRRTGYRRRVFSTELRSSMMAVSESDECVDSPLPFFIPLSSTQADDRSPWPSSACPGDDAANADDDGARKSSGRRSCKDDEEGHLVYHVGLVLKDRCACLVLSVLLSLSCPRRLI